MNSDWFADSLKADRSTSSRPQLEARIEQLQNVIAERETRRTDYKDGNRPPA